MSQARTNARRRRQAANGFKHLAPRQRPNYKRIHTTDIGAAIAAERRKAIAEAQRKTKRK